MLDLRGAEPTGGAERPWRESGTSPFCHRRPGSDQGGRVVRCIRVSPARRCDQPAGPASLLAVCALLAGCGVDGGARPLSIVLVSMDTLRADRLGAYGGARGLTPNLDHFAKEAVLFEHAYSQATTTAPSHASLFTGLYPSELAGEGRAPVLTPETPMLAEVLRVYDFQTAAFVGGADLDPMMGLGGGFDTYVAPRAFGSLWHTVPPALTWLDGVDEDRPAFLFVHGYDAHARYLKPTPYGYAFGDPTATGVGQEAVRRDPWRLVDGLLFPDLGEFIQVSESMLRPRSEEGRARLRTLGEAAAVPKVDEAEQQRVRDSYDGAVAWGDTWFGLLMAGLDEAELLEHSVVVVISDHGEQLGESGLYQHCCGLSDIETHVPLMVRMPGAQGGGRRIGAQVGLIDLMSTLIELAGGQPPAGQHGHSVVPALRGEEFTGRDVVFTQAGDQQRSVSARSLEGRLTFTGPPYTTPFLSEIVAVARLDGPGFVAEDQLPASAREPLRRQMVTWLEHLRPAPAASATPQRRAPRAGEGGPAQRALEEELKQHGYWEASP